MSILGGIPRTTGYFQTIARVMGKQRWLPMVCLNLSLLCQVCSTGFGKQAALSMPRFSPQAVLSNRYYLLSMLCLGFQSVLWPIVLRHYSLSFAYFYMSASYAAILLMSSMLFREPLTAFNLAGAALIVTGVNVLVRAQPKALQ